MLVSLVRLRLVDILLRKWQAMIWTLYQIMTTKRLFTYIFDYLNKLRLWRLILVLNWIFWSRKFEILVLGPRNIITIYQALPILNLIDLLGKIIDFRFKHGYRLFEVLVLSLCNVVVLCHLVAFWHSKDIFLLNYLRLIGLWILLFLQINFILSKMI